MKGVSKMSIPTFKIPMIHPINLQSYERYLPTAFDDSMSYLEKMNKIIHHLNLLDEVNQEVVNAWNEFMKWITGNGLNDEIQKKLDELINNGQFYDLINTQIGNLGKLIADQNAKLSFYQLKPTSDILSFGEGAVPSGSHNLIGIGEKALGNTSDKTKNNEAIGNGSQEHNKYAKYNTSLGYHTLRYLEGDPNDENVGSRNTVVGSNAMRFLKKGGSNIAMGRNAMQTAEDVTCNTSLGAGSMMGNAPLDLDDETIVNNTPKFGSYNTSLGASTLMYVSGDQNTAGGFESLAHLKSGKRNTAFGYRSGMKLELQKTYWGNRILYTNFKGTYQVEDGFVKFPVDNGQFKVGESIHIEFELPTPLHYDMTVERIGSQHIYFTKPPVTLPDTGIVVITRHVTYGEYSWSKNNIEVATDTTDLKIGHYVNMRLGSHEINWYEITGVTEGKFTVSTNVYKEGLEEGTCLISAIDTEIKVKDALDNTFIGGMSGFNADTSVGNTGVGAVALGNVSGDYNTGIGYLALGDMFTGSNNTGIGYNAGRFTSGGIPNTEYNNTTSLGFNSRPSGNNQVVLGNGDAIPHSYHDLQIRSDRRDKSDITDTSLGLDFISQLKPVDYKRTPRTGENKGERTHHGFIAQDLRSLIEETGLDFGGYQDQSIAGGEDVLTIGYTEFIAPMVKAIQELLVKVEDLENQLKVKNSDAVD